MKIRQIKFNGDQIKIVYQVAKHNGDDKHLLESKEPPRPDFARHFGGLADIMKTITDIDAEPVQVNFCHDEEGICTFQIIGLKTAKAPHLGYIDIKTPEVNADAISPAEFAIIEGVEHEAKEYINGNRAQLNLIFQ